VSTKAPYDPNHPKINRVEVYWHTVTYKTVAVYVVLLAAIVFAAIYLFDPNLVTATINKISGTGNSDSDPVPIALTQAKFVNLDGKVQVKKVNSVQWVDADFKVTLDKGDQIQTSGDGAARIEFADGTTYTVKPGTFITVEENSMGHEQPSSSAVRINVGQVDLKTPTYSSPDSKAAVSVEDTKAEMHSNSSAAVKADPDTKQEEIVVSSGTAEVQRGAEKVEIGQWEKATIPTNGGTITKSQVLAPPDLVSPRNFEPIISEDPKEEPIHFEWKAVPEAVSYNLRISTTAMFTKVVKEVPIHGTTAAEVTGLDPGDYFWTVTASDAKKQTSDVSETFRFTLVAQGKSQQMYLEIQGTQIHGRVVEIIGKTEPGAAIIVNGQPVPIIAADGTFRHFTTPLEPGQHTITIIGQNRRGGTNQKSVTIVVPK